MPDWNDDILQVSMEDIISGIAIRPEMLKDLFALSKLEHEAAKSIAGQLQSLSGLNSDESVQSIIGDALGEGESDQDTVKAIWRALVNLDEDEIPTLLKSIEKWVAKDTARQAVFTDESIKRLRENLGVLIADFAAIELMQKANKLVRDTSGEVKNIKFVCDMRPVFNDARTNIDAFVLVANLRLLYVGQNSERSVCEVALTEEELVLLKEEADKALAKMQILKQVGASLDTRKSEEGGDA